MKFFILMILTVFLLNQDCFAQWAPDTKQNNADMMATEKAEIDSVTKIMKESKLRLKKKRLEIKAIQTKERKYGKKISTPPMK
ncbi:MAG: hypothetical protein Q7U04_10580 [Bacteriovorax sp.]|nr:hypothetical protein [Bacteriovorax sp.]